MSVPVGEQKAAKGAEGLVSISLEELAPARIRSNQTPMYVTQVGLSAQSADGGPSDAAR